MQTRSSPGGRCCQSQPWPATGRLHTLCHARCAAKRRQHGAWPSPPTAHPAGWLSTWLARRERERGGLAFDMTLDSPRACQLPPQHAHPLLASTLGSGIPLMLLPSLDSFEPLLHLSSFGADDLLRLMQQSSAPSLADPVHSAEHGQQRSAAGEPPPCITPAPMPNAPQQLACCASQDARSGVGELSGAPAAAMRLPVRQLRSFSWCAGRSQDVHPGQPSPAAMHGRPFSMPAGAHQAPGLAGHSGHSRHSAEGQHLRTADWTAQVAPGSLPPAVLGHLLACCASGACERARRAAQRSAACPPPPSLRLRFMARLLQPACAATQGPVQAGQAPAGFNGQPGSVPSVPGAHTPPPMAPLLSLEDCPTQLTLPGTLPQHALQAPGIGSFCWDDILAVRAPLGPAQRDLPAASTSARTPHCAAGRDTWHAVVLSCPAWLACMPDTLPRAPCYSRATWLPAGWPASSGHPAVQLADTPGVLGKRHGPHAELPQTGRLRQPRARAEAPGPGQAALSPVQPATAPAPGVQPFCGPLRRDPSPPVS